MTVSAHVVDVNDLIKCNPKQYKIFDKLYFEEPIAKAEYQQPYDYSDEFWEKIKGLPSIDNYLDNCLPYNSNSFVSEKYGILFEDCYLDSHSYNSSNVDDNIEAAYSSFVDDYQQFQESEYENFTGYLNNLGRDSYDLEHITQSDLGSSTAAAIAVKGNKAVLIGNSNYELQKRLFAAHYGVSEDVAATYIQAHEFAHLYQKGMNLSEYEAEYDVESTLLNYFSQQVQACPEKSSFYNQLSSIANNRISCIEQNYNNAA